MVAQQQSADALAKELEALLPPEKRRLVWELRLVEERELSAVWATAEARLLEALVRHLPHQAEALRAVAAHIADTNGEADCCAAAAQGY